MDRSQSITVCPRTWTVSSVAATWRRLSRSDGRRTGQERPAIRTERAAVTGTGKVAVVKASTLEVRRGRPGFSVYGRGSQPSEPLPKGATVPHIDLPEGLPGIIGPMAFRPETAKPLNDLAEVLLREKHPDNDLTRGERELIAAYVSKLNDCHFCHSSHATFAALQLDDGWDTVDAVIMDLDGAPVVGQASGPAAHRRQGAGGWAQRHS